VDKQQPEFGEQVVSASTLYYRLCPPGSYREEAPPNEADMAEMNRLRGLVIVQASEIEAVLSKILRHFSPSANTDRPPTARELLEKVRPVLANLFGISCTDTLDLIDRAIKRRNRVVHDTVTIGSVWVPFWENDGEWVPVISLLGLELCDETDLRSDLALQQKATVAAVHLLVALTASDTEGAGGGHEIHDGGRA
jgi:hypothetical protein